MAQKDAVTHRWGPSLLPPHMLDLCTPPLSIAAHCTRARKRENEGGIRREKVRAAGRVGEQSPLDKCSVRCCAQQQGNCKKGRKIHTSGSCAVSHSAKGRHANKRYGITGDGAGRSGAGAVCVRVSSELLLGSTSWDKSRNVTMAALCAYVLYRCNCALFNVLMQKHAFSCSYTTWTDFIHLTHLRYKRRHICPERLKFCLT